MHIKALGEFERRKSSGRPTTMTSFSTEAALRTFFFAPALSPLECITVDGPIFFSPRLSRHLLCSRATTRRANRERVSKP